VASPYCRNDRVFSQKMPARDKTLSHRRTFCRSRRSRENLHLAHSTPYTTLFRPFVLNAVSPHHRHNNHTFHMMMIAPRRWVGDGCEGGEVLFTILFKRRWLYPYYDQYNIYILYKNYLCQALRNVVKYLCIYLRPGTGVYHINLW